MSIRRVSFYLSLTFLVLILAGIPIRSQFTETQQTGGGLIAGRNVNMVSGTQLPYGDPWLQRQNEPSIAVSTRNPLHLLAGANDYRTIDMPEELQGEPLPGHIAIGEGREPWVGIFKSFDGGQTWITTLLPGFPLDYGSDSPLKLEGWEAAADPVVRAGTNGLFYYSGIAFNRVSKQGVLFVARFIDNNNLETHTIKEKDGVIKMRDCIKYLDTKIIARGLIGLNGSFIDKPWIAVDLPQGKGQKVIINGQSIARHSVYLAFAEFTGSGTIQDPLKSTIRFAQSDDCGETWTAPIDLSTGNDANQGATIAVDPRGNGHICVAWRRFAKQTNNSGNSIFIARSVNGGKKFNKVIEIASFDPFDQPSWTDRFRTNSYPTLAIDDTGRIYIAWSQRTGGSSRFSRLVLATSINGIQWSKPNSIDDPGAQGHQIMPTITFAAGKLMLAWYDQRNDIPGSSSPSITGQGRILDVSVAEAKPGENPVFKPSIQVSRYRFVLKDDGKLEQVQFNHVNYPLFKGGTWPFMGDYIDIAPSPMFVLDKSGQWRYNSEPSNTPVYYVTWTDNRDVRLPTDGDWTKYSPPNSTQVYPYGQENLCSSYKNAGMRNQNIYISSITKGIIAGSPWNTKPLGTLGETPDGVGIPRAFVVLVKNTTGETKSFRLSIANQPQKGRASFLEFVDLFKLDVEIAPYSSISRSVFVYSSDPKATVRIDVAEIYKPDGTLIPGGLESYVLLNPEIENPEIENPEIENPEIENNILAYEYHNPEIENYDVFNRVLNPEIINPEIENPEIINPEIINPEIENPEIINPEIENPEIINPEIENINIKEQVNITDVIWRVQNKGNTTSTYMFKTLSSAANADGTLPDGIQAQLLVYRVYKTPALYGIDDPCELREQQRHELIVNIVNPEIENPEIENPEIENPEIENPEIENATFSLPPEGEALVLLRLWKSNKTSVHSLNSAKTLSIEDIISTLVGYASGTARNTKDLQQGIPTYPDDTSVYMITTKTLASGKVGQAYSDFLTASGGAGDYKWLQVGGTLPEGLSIDYNTGEVAGTPAIGADGTYTFTAQVTDSAGEIRTRDVWLTIFPAAGGYTISGRATVGYEGLGGVTMNVSSGTPVTTDSAGYYSISVSPGWSGTVTPTKTGHTFTPASTTYSNVTSNQTTNYAAVAVVSDTTPPTVSTFDPADNALNVLLDKDLKIIFSENVVAGTGNIVIKKSSDDTVYETIDVKETSKVTISDNIVTINPGGTFVNSTEYYVQIANACFKDAAGNSYGGISDKFTWNFTTISVLSPTVGYFLLAGGTGSVMVSMPAGSPWTAVSNDLWITISSGSPGTGSGTVGYSVTLNSSASVRTGTMTIAGYTFTVHQLEGTTILMPSTLEKTLIVGESHAETKTATLPAGEAISKVDVMFMFDLTGSMTNELATMKAESNNIMTGVRGLVPDSAFGVISFMDYVGTFTGTCSNYALTYGSGSDYPYRLDQSVTTETTAVTNAINGLLLGYGNDSPESYSRALYETYSGTTVGWRTGAKKIVILFCDDIPHDPAYGTGVDPGTNAIACDSDDLYFAKIVGGSVVAGDVVNGLVANGITVLVLDSGTNHDPWNLVASATGGVRYGLTHNEANQIPQRIADLIQAQVEKINLLTLRAEPGYEAWISFTPPGGHSNVLFGETKTFALTITVPPGTAIRKYTFRVELVGDGTVLGWQTVTITVQ